MTSLHTLRSHLLALVLAALASACASAPDVAPAAPDIAPVPFPATTIRAATHDGRAYVFHVEEAGKPPVVRRIQFSAVDDAGASIAAGEWPVDAAAPGELAPPERVSWGDLEAHAHFPRAATRVSDEATEVPAGRFDCRLYTVRGDDGSVSRFWFATALPGAPVRVEVTSGDALLLRMQLVEHVAGTP